LNHENCFCDDNGQRFVGIISRRPGWFTPDNYIVRAEGTPDIAHAITLVERAEGIEPNQWFADVDSSRACRRTAVVDRDECYLEGLS
jgi:hypothetical protein